ncbi:MAG: M16 family metallopeptidase [Candidatus Polarisedimenticolia bacterium]
MTPTRWSLGVTMCALVAAGPVPAREELNLEQLRIPHTKHVLPNGLTLVVHEDHSVPLVSVNLWYHVGSRNERRGRTGFAHLFEHFFFNGSENYPHGFREAMDDLGANNRNGTTSNDRTNFFEDVPVSALERTLYLEADRMGFLAGNLSQEMLERERGVVKNEKRQGENQPYGSVFSRIVEAIYPYEHPYSWPTIGNMQDLDAATLDDVKEWYQTFYGPGNCVLVLAGDITSARALELVTRYFGSIQPGPPLPRHQAWVPAFDRNMRDSMEDRVPQARLYRIWHAPGWGRAELIDLGLAAGVLGGSRSSRLERRLVYEKELATSVSVSIFDREIAGNFLVIVTVKPGVDPAAAEEEMEAVMADYLKTGPTPEELERGRTRALAGFLRDMERLLGRSDILAEHTLYAGDPEAYLSQFAVLNAATPARVLETSRRWLDTHHYTMLVTPAPPLEASAAEIDRKVLPALGEAPGVTFPKMQQHRMANGLSIVLMERHTAPLVNMTLALDAGFAADPVEAPGTASLALTVMQEGTRTRDTFRISDDLDALGAGIVAGNSLDLSYVRLRALKMNLAGSMDLFADVVLNPAFPEAMVQLDKKRQIARIGQEKAQPAAVALRIAPRLLYGERHAYGAPLTGSGTEASVQAMTREALASWHGAWFHPGNATLIVAGDITMAELVPLAEKAFGAWKKGESPRKNVAEVPRTAGGKVYLIDKPDAPQSVIAAAHVSERGGAPDDLAIETVMRLFGGMATSRLNRNLRLEKHWSYGVTGMLMDARGQRPFAIIAPVQTDKTRESLEELVKELRAITGGRPIAGEEYESIQRNVVSRLPSQFESLASLEGAAMDVLSYGYLPEHFYEYGRRLKALSAGDLNAAAARFIRPQDVIWIVVGDLEKIEPGIRELKLGEIVRLGADGRLLGLVPS